jgi:hypothetical protein
LPERRWSRLRFLSPTAALQLDPATPKLRPLDPGLDPRTIKTASRAAISLYIWSTPAGSIFKPRDG